MGKARSRLEILQSDVAKHEKMLETKKSKLEIARKALDDAKAEIAKKKALVADEKKKAKN